MATQRETIDFLLQRLRPRERFSARAMFGEFALYADGKIVALVCDDRLYVKIVPASNALETLCEKGPPYPGAKPHYIVEEGHLSTIPMLSEILFAIASAAPIRKRSKTKR
jgi:TfoX/Sxy family transcriptional regulator of competence genes